MKKSFILFLIFPLILLLSQSVFSQEKVETTALNRITLLRNDTVYQFFTIKPTKKIKRKAIQSYYWYTPDTILITEKGFDGKLLNGSYKVFYPNKNLRETGNFRYGLKTGEWKNWYLTGQLQSLTNWKNGKKEGAFQEFDTTGKIAKSGSFKHDHLSGEITEYKDGVEIKAEYKNGVLIKEKSKQETKQVKKEDVQN